MNQLTLVFLGTQGSGKGTQVELLKEFLQKNDPNRPVVYFEAGAELRAFGTKGGYTQDLVDASLKRGELQPSFISGYLMAQTLFSSIKTGDEHLFVDGFPRNEGNLLEFHSIVDFYKRIAPTLVHITISDEEAVRRLMKRGRNDDTEEGIRKRLAWTRSQVNPIIEQFRANPKYHLLDIDGERSIEDIHQDILNKLGLS